jgi:predicted DNA-binding WGR domain protein
MSDWQVHLEFEEGTSSKFWRARVDGPKLYVNYGKIGTNGQTQVKDLGSPESAQKEIDKLEREKRKKGYQDAGSGGGREEAEEGDDEEEEDDDDEAEKPAPKKKAAGQSKRLLLDARGRQVETVLTLDGATVRMNALETYPTPEAARQAFYRLLAQLAGEGHEET